MQRKCEDTGCNKSALTARVVSGCVGSVVTSLVVTPLEVVKVRIQAAASPSSVYNVSSALPSNVVPCPRGCGTAVLYNGHMDCVMTKASAPSLFIKPPQNNVGTLPMVRQIFQQEGLAGIYAGFRPTLVMAVPNTVLYFAAYDEIVFRLRTSDLGRHRSETVRHMSTWLFPLLAGASARLVSSTVTAPFELIRTRQAALTGGGVGGGGQAAARPNGLWNEFAAIVRAGGYRSLYKGLTPTLWRDVPFSAIYWLSLEQLRLCWQLKRDAETTPLEQAGQAFVNGAVSGMVAAACTTPFDVIKTRQQARDVDRKVGNACTHNGASVYKAKGTFGVLQDIARSEGVGSLWRGNQARVLKVAPGCAIMISSYELGKRILE